MPLALTPPSAPFLPPTVALPAVGRAAVAALYDELALYPKPGLVSLVDSGSHTDMDASTFLRSLFSLRHYFPEIAALGAADAPFASLRDCGQQAEARMVRATGGVNTHRGAIFLLGLLCAASGRLAAVGGVPEPDTVRGTLLAYWGRELREHAGARRELPGSTAARRLGLRSAAQEAAEGLPVLFDHVLPRLQQGLRNKLTVEQSRLDALFTAIVHLDDTNLAHRGGMAGLEFARESARSFLATGGAGRPGGLEAAQSLHREFVARRLSPGGAADTLAAACWLVRLPVA